MPSVAAAIVTGATEVPAASEAKAEVKDKKPKAKHSDAPGKTAGAEGTAKKAPVKPAGTAAKTSQPAAGDKPKADGNNNRRNNTIPPKPPVPKFTRTPGATAAAAATAASKSPEAKRKVSTERKVTTTTTTRTSTVGVCHIFRLTVTFMLLSSDSIIDDLMLSAFVFFCRPKK